MTPLPHEHVEAVCLIGRGALCCRYLMGTVQGLACGKHTELRSTIDARVGSMRAKGDNCPGFDDQSGV